MPRLVSPADLAYLAHPPIPLAVWLALARAQGRFDYLVRREARSAIRENLCGVLARNHGDAEVERMTRQFFLDARQRRVLLQLAPRMSLAGLSQLLPLDGLDRLDRAVSEGRGVLLLCSHLNSTCNFVAVILLRRLGYDVRVALPVAEDQWAPTRLRQFTDRMTAGRSLREHIGGFFCQFNIRPIIKCLSERAVVVQTGDGWHSAGFVDVPFVGRRLPFTSGVMRVAQVTGAPVVPMFLPGVPPRGLRVVFEEPFHVAKGPDAEAELRDKVGRFAGRLEHHLRENVVSWQHWEVPRVLDMIATWPQRTLSERYGQ